MEFSTCLPESRDVEFQDVYYTVTERKNYIKIIGKRQILRGVSGSFRNGQLSAIMGPSGAGKSSLLNAVSGYRTSDVKGHVQINRKSSCYITQEDNLQTLLSVEELMHLSCDLKLKTDRSRKNELIAEILQELKLSHRREVKANKLSGGERKRLSIALELVANPKIFFLDEPTSGLDEVTALQCIRLLSQLAKRGHTVVCTVHQPSATMLGYFDNVYVLARGLCVYQGSPSAMVPFLQHAQFDCPKHYSPSDYIIELCDAEEGKLIPQLSDLTDNGKLIYYSSDAQTKRPSCGQAVKTFFLDEPKRCGLRTLFPTTATSVATDGSLIGGVSALCDHVKAFRKLFGADRGQISGFHQFCVLFRMMMLRTLRARIPIIIQFIHYATCGLCFGLLFWKLGNQGSHMFAHLKFCISTILMIVYTQVIVPVLSYPSEVKIMKKETFNHWYTLTPYFMALNISRLPLQICFNVMFLTVIYWMSGFPSQWWRFALFVAVGLMTSFVAEGMGLAIGATFNITNGTIVGPLVIMPLMGLAIYGFDFAAEIPYAMNLFMKFSYMRDGVVALVLTLFGFGRDVLDCDEIYCHFSDPRVLLKFLDIEHVTLLHQFTLLIALLIFFRTLLFLSLRKRCRT